METIGNLIFDVILIVICLWYFTGQNDKDWQEQMIERGYGQYCTDTGEFAFAGEC